MKITFALVFVALVAVVSARTKWFQLEKYTFEKYMVEYGKKYADEREYAFRKAIFEDRLESIKNHNKDSSKTWKEGVNRFTDRTQEEFNKLLGLKKGLLYSRKPSYKVYNVLERDVADLPTNVDWREKGIISPVKDQGECGSCWSFGTAETVESYYSQSTNLLPILSEQQILDCTPNTNDCGGTGGCNGGTPELAYSQIMQMGGLSSEWTYSYNSYFGDAYACNYSRIDPVATLTSFNVLPSNQYSPVLNYLATNGPLAVNVDASAWSSYETGVFSGCNMQDPDIDHVVQLVGYGTDQTLGDYWLIRNSWSPSWGEQGYIRLQRNSSPPCGVDTKPSDGTGCNNGPANVTVCGTSSAILKCENAYSTHFWAKVHKCCRLYDKHF